MLNGWRKDDPGMIFRIPTELCWRGDNVGDGDDGDDSDDDDSDGDVVQV